MPAIGKLEESMLPYLLMMLTQSEEWAHVGMDFLVSVRYCIVMTRVGGMLLAMS